MQFFRKEDVSGKKVIDADGNPVGVATDIAFSLEGNIALVVKKPEEGEVTIPVDRVSAVGEFVILKPERPTATAPAPPPPTPAAPPMVPPTPTGVACPACGHPNKPGAKFCGKCGAQLPGAGSSLTTKLREKVGI